MSLELAELKEARKGVRVGNTGLEMPGGKRGVRLLQSVPHCLALHWPLPHQAPSGALALLLPTLTPPSGVKFSPSPSV